MSVVKAVAPNIVVIGVKLFFARILFPTNLYNKFLSKQVSSVDVNARPAYIETFIECIKLTKANSRKYKTADSETGAICNTYLVFKPYYAYVYKHVKVHRIKVGL